MWDGGSVPPRTKRHSRAAYLAHLIIITPIKPKLSYNNAVDVEKLPSSAKGREYELRALSLRDFAGVREDEPLDPFELARYAKIWVVDFDVIEGLAPAVRQTLLNAGAEAWSGGTCSHNLPNGWRLVILNPTQAPQRAHATLMEEICHVFLGHQANRLAVETRDENGQLRARDYVAADEEAAYSIGAAALVPYTSLQKFIRRGWSIRDLAQHFRVSRPLVEFRLKVTRLWDEYKFRRNA